MTFDAPMEKDNFNDNIDKFKEAFNEAFKEALSSLPTEFKILDHEIDLELKPFSPFDGIAVYIIKGLYYAEVKTIKNDFQNELFINKFNAEIEDSVSDVNIVKVTYRGK